MGTKASRIVIIALVAGACGPLCAQYSGGDGSPENPFQIAESNDLVEMGQHPDDWDKHFILTTDLDLTGITVNRIGYDFDHRFSGRFDGQGYTLSHLTIHLPDERYVGLFGTLDSSGQINNLGLIDVDIKGRHNTGSLVGSNLSGTLCNCYATGVVLGSSNAGGLVGINSGMIINCYATLDFTGGRSIGGLVGCNSSGQITNCYATGSVTGQGSTGGLVGSNSGTITNSYATGAITGSSSTGGLIGHHSGTIAYCYATGIVSGAEETGGLVGSIYSTCTIMNCYATGDVTGTYNTGGLVGYISSEGTITNCYATGALKGSTSTGSLVGRNDDCTIMNCFWDRQTSGVQYSMGGLGLTTRQMQDMNTYIFNGWSGTIWTLPVNDYPHLAWENAGGEYISDPVVTLEGSGTEGDPWQIATAADMVLISTGSYFWDKHFILTADINLSGVMLNRIGYNHTHRFIGCFDGRGHTLSHLIIHLPSNNYIGLFGIIGSGGQVKNLGLIDVDIQGSLSTGGLVGCNYRGTITNCYLTGTIKGGHRTGVLIGYNGGSITNCYSSGSVIGSYNTGGLVGINSDTITNCYAKGNVTGTGYSTGGLVGHNSDTITNCYATGTVTGSKDTGGLVGKNNLGTIQNCFWDIETTGQETSDGGLGLTTSQMQDMITYSFNGWAGTTWTLPANDYPHLAWENVDGEYISDPVVTLAGNGTEEDPWQIFTVEDLILVSYSTYFWDKHFILMADIDLSGVTINQIGYDNDNTFTGSFDGQGHTLSNLTIHLPNEKHVGLFGYLDSDGQVKNLGLIDVDIQGGIFTGSLVGQNSGGTITNSYATGAIKGSNCIGGLVGSNYGTITNCFATGAITGSNSIGGLVGTNFGTITNCYATGAISSDNNAGGLVGNNLFDGVITNCYAIGAVTGDNNTGGLLGYDSSGTITNCFWDIEASEQETSAGGIGLTTGEMQDSLIYGLNGWGGTTWTLPADDYPHLAWENAGGDYISDLPMGNGTAEDPWQIATAADLVLISSGTYFWDKHFALMADIDMTGVTLNQIGCDYIHPFTGSFDGQGHALSHLTLLLPDHDYVGMFGYLGTNGLVHNLGLIYVNIQGEDFIGGLVGYNNNGTIKNCFATGAVTGNSCVGGLVGSDFEGMITDCYTTGTITGDNLTGGLVGYSYMGKIMNCYATGAVTGIDYTGGLVGDKTSGEITSCYATGAVIGGYYIGGLVGSNNGAITNCYSAGAVTGTDYTGGLIGSNGGTITICYATGNVTGADHTGGLVGYNYEVSITNCYARGAVMGADDTGGLVGWNQNGMIRHCYATGAVTGADDTGGLVGWNHFGTIITSFWDCEASGQKTSDGGLGLTTSQMQDTNTYLDTGWDFDSIWYIYVGADFPLLQWQCDEVLKIIQMDIKAGKYRDSVCDSFAMEGIISSIHTKAITTQSEDLSIISLAVITEEENYFYGHVEELNPLKVKVDSKQNRIIYQSSVKSREGGRITSLTIDLVSGNFTASAKNLDLTGLRSPITVELVIGNHLGTCTAYDGEVLGSGGQIDTINGPKPMPVQFMMGIADTLRVDKSKFKLGTKKPGSDSLTVQGAITVEDTSVNIAAEDVTIQWGTYSVTLPADTLYQRGSKWAFKYKKPKGSDSSVAAAIFDLEKCTFKIVIKNAYIGDQGETVDFGIQFGSFDETVSLTP